MAKRVLAVIGAIALVLAAAVVRSLIDGDDDPDEGRPSGATARVVCDPDLRRPCESLASPQVRVEDSAVTSAAIVAGDADVDVWVTSSAWAELTAARLQRTSAPLGDPVLLASSPVGLHVFADRAAVLEDACAGEPTWGCIGDAAGRPWSDLGGPATWGTVRIGLPDPDTAVGLATLSAVAVGHFGDTDFAANDFGPLRDWLARLAQPSRGGDRSLLRTLLRVRGTYDGAALTAAEAGAQAELAVVATEPEVRARIVVVPVRGDLPDTARRALHAALVDAGWDSDDLDGEVEALLAPGVMGALHQLWKDVVR